MDRQAMADEIWQNQRRDIEEIVKLVAQYTGAHEKLETIMSEAGWSSDVMEARRDFAAHGRSWWRFFSGPYSSSTLS